MVVSKLCLLFVSALMALFASSAAAAGDPDSSLASVTGPQPTVRRAISDAEVMTTLKNAAHVIERRMKNGYTHQYPPLNLSSASASDTTKIPGTSSLYLLQKNGKQCLTSNWNMDSTFNKQACYDVGGGPAKDGGWVCYYWVEVHNNCMATAGDTYLNCWDSANGKFNSQLPIFHLSYPLGGSKYVDGYSCRLHKYIAPGETYRFDYLAYGQSTPWEGNRGPWNMWVMDAKWI